MKPILFNTEMVQAILEGRKTVTRRLIKPQPEPFGKAFTYKNMICSVSGLVKQAKYQVGDVLYTKEMFGKDRHGEYHYRADYPEQDCEPYPIWHQSHHMPKEAARMFLKVTDVRVERLQDITAEQSIKEGIEHDDIETGLCEFCPVGEKQRGVKNYGNGPIFCVDSGGCEIAKGHFEDDCVDCFSDLWDSIIEKQDIDQLGWSANPWVWVYEFERVEKPEGEEK